MEVAAAAAGRSEPTIAGVTCGLYNCAYYVDHQAHFACLRMRKKIVEDIEPNNLEVLASINLKVNLINQKKSNEDLTNTLTANALLTAAD